MNTHLLVEVCLSASQRHLDQLLAPLRQVDDGGTLDGGALGATQQDGTQQQLQLLEALWKEGGGGGRGVRMSVWEAFEKGWQHEDGSQQQLQLLEPCEGNNNIRKRSDTHKHTQRGCRGLCCECAAEWHAAAAAASGSPVRV
jgi:hypothetical protein